MIIHRDSNKGVPALNEGVVGMIEHVLVKIKGLYFYRHKANRKKKSLIAKDNFKNLGTN